MNKPMGAEKIASFTFAHLSDPHLTSLDDVAWRDLTNKRILGYLSWRHKRRDEHRLEVLDALQRDLLHTRPEQIVITGDLTHIGLPEEFRQVRHWLDQLGDADRVSIIPGNHDAYIRTPWKYTMSHWEPWMRSDVRAGDPWFPSLRVRGDIAFIGLSSARATRPFMATGTLGEAQLQRLSQLLEETGRKGLFRVVMLHHPPRPQDEKWRKRLTDGKRLCRVLEQHGAEAVLHGHSHRPMQRALEHAGREIPVFGVASASAIGRKPGRRAQYNVFTVGKTDGCWHLHQLVRSYQLENDRFVLAHEHRFELATG